MPWFVIKASFKKSSFNWFVIYNHILLFFPFLLIVDCILVHFIWKKLIAKYWSIWNAFRLAGHRTCFTLLLMLDVSRGTVLSIICRQMHFQDDFSINNYPNFDLKFSNFSDSKTIGNVIIWQEESLLKTWPGETMAMDI